MAANTPEQIAAWAEQQQPQPAEKPSYTRLTRADHMTIMHLHDEGLTLTAIAERLNRSVSTIHEVVQIYQPTTDLAKRKLAASALQMAENVIDNGQPRDHVQALRGIGVLEGGESNELKIGIAIGLPGLPIQASIGQAGQSMHEPTVTVCSAPAQAQSSQVDSVSGSDK